MQPNEQPGFYRPDQGQPVAPDTPVAPAAPAAPAPAVAQPVQPAEAVGQLLEQSAPVGEDVQPGSDEVGEDFEQEEGEEVDLEQPISWTAHEYIHREKGALWYFIFSILVIGGVGGTIWLGQYTFTAVLIIIAIIVVVYLRRPPRDLTYSLTEDGLVVDNKLYKYENFKSFGVIEDGEHYSIMLIPVQRFQPSLTVYFPEEVGEDIVDVLGSIMQMKDLKLDAVDQLVRMLRL